MKMPTSSNRTYTFSRYFSIASLLGILVAAVALTELYRKTSIDTIVQLGEHNNTIIAKTALNAIETTLLGYLEQVSMNKEEMAKKLTELTLLEDSVVSTMQGTSVARIKIYAQDGAVVYSTKPAQIGQDGSQNRGFISAMNGDITSKLIYRGTFNVFDRESDDANLIQTYIPVYGPVMTKPLGVFELYTDVNSLVNEIERTSFLVIIGVVAILGVLYSFLWMIVRKADRIIQRQQSVLRARGNTLELISAEVLIAEERERKKIAVELHENIAQSLVAVKLHIEAACPDTTIKPEEKNVCTEICNGIEDNIIPQIQSIIQEVRALAMELRPPSLDDIGLLATIGWLCREVESIYPEVHVDKEFLVNEHQIPKPLKIVIFRILKEILGDIGKQGVADKLSIKLKEKTNRLELIIEDNALAYHPSAPAESSGQYADINIASIKRRVLFSGGSFNMDSNQQGGTIYRMEWDA